MIADNQAGSQNLRLFACDDREIVTQVFGRASETRFRSEFYSSEKSRKTLCLWDLDGDYEILSFHVFLLFSLDDKKKSFSATQNPAIIYSSFDQVLLQEKRRRRFRFPSR